MTRVLPLLALLLLVNGEAEEDKWSVWPVPAHLRASGDAVPLSDDFAIKVVGGGPVMRDAVRRCEAALARRFATRRVGRRRPHSSFELRTLELEVFSEEERLDSRTDYSYNVTVDKTVRIRAFSSFGAAYGLETFLQLVWVGNELPADLVIVDKPASRYRGLLIDVARHWMPLVLLRRTIDAMASAKMNVLHLHLTDSQSFPLVLDEEHGWLGAFSEQETYTAGDLRGLVEYAHLRGVRIVPEIDTPAHTLSWAKAHPGIVVNCSLKNADSASASDLPALDPTNPETYEVVERVLKAVSEIFPDELFHIGADEVHQECWAHLKEHETLNSMYLERIVRFVSSLGKRPVLWQDALDGSSEKLQTALKETRSVVESWKCWSGLAESAGLKSAALDLEVIDASCRYLDWPSPWLNYAAASRVVDSVGGEAAMWTEDVDWTNLECRTWPRAAAVANALWGTGSSSPRGLAKFGEETLRLRLGVQAARLHDSTGETGVAKRGFCPSLARSAPRSPARPPAFLGVAALNVDGGCHHDASRMAHLKKWMKKEREAGTVVLALTELNDWGQVGPHGETLFQRLAADAGFAFTSLLNTEHSHPYNLGVASMAQITRLRAFEPPEFERGALMVETGGLHVVVAHLNAHDAKERLVEAKTLAASLKDYEDKPLILLGDLNTLSPLDSAVHQKAGLLDWLKQGEAGHHRMERMRRKFLANATGQVFIDYAPMAALLEHLTDTGSSEPTEPTALEPDSPELPDGIRRLPIRVDFALVNAALASFNVTTAVQTADGFISDHFPIRAFWRPDPDGGGEASAFLQHHHRQHRHRQHRHHAAYNKLSFFFETETANAATAATDDKGPSGRSGELK